MARTAPTAKTDILRAASRCFARSGYRGATLRDIAQEYGGSKAALLYHFESKEAILTELLRDHWKAVDALVVDLRGRRGDDARETAIRGMADLAVRYRDVIAVVHTEIREIIHLPAFRGAAAAMDEIVDALAARSSAPFDLMLARVVLGAVATASRELESASDDELRSAVAHVMRGALGGCRRTT